MRAALAALQRSAEHAPLTTRRLTRRGFLLAAGLALAGCAEGAAPVVPSPYPTAGPAAPATVSPAATARSASASPSPTLA
ncbi:MAG TPA: hypothetical protein VF770_03540, partial [Solirubrobacterales bacterium]